MPGFDVDAARKAGYGDDEILSHLTQTRKFDIDGARKAGYSNQDIITHLATAPAPAAAGKPRTWLDSVADFGKGAMENLSQTGEGMVNMVAHPIDTVKGIGQAQDEVRLKAEKAFKSGDYATGVRHVLGYLVPVVGPAIDALGDQAQGGEVARSLGGATSLGLQLAGPSALARTVPRPPPGAPPAPRPSLKVESRLNPVEQGAVDFLRENEVPLNVGTITGNRFAKATQAIAQNQPLGASTAMRAARATEEGLTRVAGELADQAHPQPVSPESAGQAVPAALGKKIAGLGLEEDAAYAKAWEGRNNPAHTYDMPVRMEQKPVPGPDGKTTMQAVEVRKPVNMPVDVRDIKAELQPVYQEMQWMPASDRASSAGYQAVKNILEGDDFIPAWQAEKGLSGLKAMARTTNKSGVRNTSQGIGASIIPDLQEQVNAAVANTGDEAIRGLQQGRALHASKMEVAEVAEQLRTEPVQTFGQLTWRQDTGIDFLRKVNEQTPDVLPQVGRAFIQKLFDTATQEGGFGRARTLLNNWEDLGPQTKALLFKNPLLRENLDRFFKGAAMVAENPNPSGTAVVGSLIPGGMLMIHNPVSGGAWLLGGYAASKLLFSPKGVTLLTRGLKPSSPSAAGFAATEIVRMAGQDARRLPPGEAGGEAGAWLIPPAPPKPIGPAAIAPGPGTPRSTGPVEYPARGPAPGAILRLRGVADDAIADLRGRSPAVEDSPVPAANVGVRKAGGGAETSVLIPGEDTEYASQYRVRELSDLRSSHHGFSFEKNADYPYTNDRDYTKPTNQMRVIGQAKKFNSRYLITDNPDATNGPPVVDVDGNAIGGNSRVMTLQRVYSQHPEAAKSYRALLEKHADRYGIDPKELAGMKQPVLVREVTPDEAIRVQNAITDLNKSGTAQLGPSERAIVDSRRVSSETLSFLDREIERLGEGGSAAKVLAGDAGAEMVRRLVEDGAITDREMPQYLADGKLTAEGKQRIGRLMIGRFFRDVKHFDETAPALRNKLEKIASPLAVLEQRPEWDVMNAPIREGLALLDEARTYNLTKLEDVEAQQGMFGQAKYSPAAYEWAYRLKNNSERALSGAFKKYVEMESRSRPDSTPDMFAPPPVPQAEAFQEAFGKLRTSKRN